MADELRMALEELLGKVEREQDVDFLREGVRVLSQALLELDVTQQRPGGTRSRTPRADGESNRAAQWLPRTGLGHAGGHD